MTSGFHFVANLKPYTLHRGPGNRRFGSYLLSIDYARELGDLAREVIADGAVLCADNGNVDLIRSLIAEHDPEAKALDAERRALAATARRSLRPRDVPTVLRERHRAFARSVGEAAKAKLDPARIAAAVKAQIAMRPTYLVGMEDFTIATLTALDVEPEIASMDRRFIEGLAKRAVDLAALTQSGHFGATAAMVFAGVHAFDRDTARIVGGVAGAAGVGGIATGLVGALQDKSFIDYLIEDGAIVELGESVPRPYVRVAQVAAGLHEGFVAASGRRPAFHALGAGSPILLPLLAALGDGTTYTATDSTAPIVDGWSGPTISLYVADPAPLKYKGYRIAEEWIANDRAWGCPCPYCHAFDRAAPPQLDKARAWWRSHGKPKLTADSLRAPSPLAGWLPLFGTAADPGLRLTGAMARVGHNHWVLQQIETQARKHARSHAQIVEWTDTIVRNYTSSSADPPWKRAVETAWRIIRRAADATREARPTQLPT